MFAKKESLTKRTRILTILAILFLIAVLAVGVYFVLVASNEYTITATLNGEETIIQEYGTPFQDPGAQAYVTGSILNTAPQTLDITVTGAVNHNTLGSYQLVYTASYKGITKTLNRTVKIVDTQAPQIILKYKDGAYTLPGHTYQEEGFVAQDGYDGDITSQVQRTFKDGIVTYTVTDSSGNRAEVKRSVLYKDPDAPVLSLQGDAEIIISAGDTFVDPGCTATDNCDGDLTSNITVTGTVDTAVPGTYILTYSVSDAYGNKAEISRTVVCKDTTPPVLTLIGDQTVGISLNQTYVEKGCTATDNCDGDVTANITFSGSVDSSRPGTYVITYTVTDASGNTAEIQRTIVCEDNVSPMLTLLGETTITINQGDSFADPGYTAIDNLDGNITAKVLVRGHVDTQVPGTYTLAYDIKDSRGNKTSAIRTVKVADDPAIGPNLTPEPTGKVIYLTFDDGPSAHTQKLLDVLAKYNVEATFFVVKTGSMNMLSKITSAGHAIGIHSISHEYREIYASEEAYLNDLYSMQNLIREKTGVTTYLMRFPGGSSNKVSSFNKGIMSHLTKEVERRGFQYFDWNVSSGDAGGTSSSDGVYNNVINGLKSKTSAIVLQHDIYRYSVDAVERIIQWGLANGYTFAPLTMDSPTSHHKVVN